MKKYTNKQQTGGGYDGCVAVGLKLTTIGAVIIAICIILSSCATTKKDGCGTENYKHAFKK